MTEEKMSPLRQRMIPSRDIAAQYPAGQWRTCASVAWATNIKSLIFGQSRISQRALGDHQIPRRRRTCAPISFI